jgi:hypothetical protein
MALARQCLHDSRQAFVVSQHTKIGASEKSVRIVQGGLVKIQLTTTIWQKPEQLALLFNVRYIDSILNLLPLSSSLIGEA